MNCKPNDIARIISTDVTRTFKVSDKIVKITDKTMVSEFGLICWFLEKPLYIRVFGIDHEIVTVEDDLLRPIRGLDGPDETLTWCDVPTKELA